MTELNSLPKYNILMLAPTMFFADYGSHVRILEEAVSLRALGHRVTILAYPNGHDIAGLKVVRCWGVPFNYRIIVGSSRHRFYLDAMLALKGLQVMCQVKPDLIHAHLHEGGLIGAVLSRLWRIPLVLDFQGSLTSEMIDHRWLAADSAFYKPLRWLERQIDHQADTIITSSHNAERLLCNDFECDRANVHTVSDGVNPGIFRPDVLDGAARAALRAQYGIPAGAQVVIYLGLLADYQGIPQLIQAAKRVLEQRPDTFFLIFGFPNVTHYQNIAQSIGVADRVLFPGAVPYEEVPVKLALGDVAAAPKLSATEGAGKILNYMSMALPVVAFDTPVSREYLGDCGVYAAPRDVEELAAGFLTVLNDPADARWRGQCLRTHILERYTWEHGAIKITEVYQKVCPRPRSML